ncbi:MAG: hypothetical protein ACLRQR_14430, partial [Merdimonas faecis]|uniref:hypothetical protein n=1 Tax=Merdimonas faecis TaxID=1653435 RepID=UPI0039906424
SYSRRRRCTEWNHRFSSKLEKGNPKPEKQLKTVAVTHDIMQLQLHKVFNVQLQFQCCSKNFN